MASMINGTVKPPIVPLGKGDEEKKRFRSARSGDDEKQFPSLPRRFLPAAALLLAPSAAMACPVCFASANPHVLATYYLTTVLLMLLPLAIVGSIAGWLYFRCRDTGAESAQTDQDGRFVCPNP